MGADHRLDPAYEHRAPVLADGTDQRRLRHDRYLHNGHLHNRHSRSLDDLATDVGFVVIESSGLVDGFFVHVDHDNAPERDGQFDPVTPLTGRPARVRFDGWLARPS